MYDDGFIIYITAKLIPLKSLQQRPATTLQLTPLKSSQPPPSLAIKCDPCSYIGKVYLLNGLTLPNRLNPRHRTVN